MPGLGAGLGSNAQVTVGLIGDSNLAGYGSVPGDSTKNCGCRYPLWVRAKAAGINCMFIGSQTLPGPDAGVRQIYHDAVSGDNIQSAINRANLRVGYFPEIIFVMMGAIDVMALASDVTMASQLDTLITTLWLNGQRPGVNRTKLIIVAQIGDVFTGANIAAMHALTIAFNNRIPGVVAGQVALGRNVKVLDTYTPLGANPGPNWNAGSQPHQSEAGYNLLAPLILGTPGSGLLIDYGR